MKNSYLFFRTVPAVLHTYLVIVSLLPILLYARVAMAQNPEFIRNPNGLIYSEQTMGKLRNIVDSLNLKFKVCALNPSYKAFPQAIGHYVFLKKGNLKQVKSDLENNITFDQFLLKYKPKAVARNLLIIKTLDQDYENNPELEFRSISIGESEENSLIFKEQLDWFERPLQGKWIVKYNAKDEYSDESIEAFFIIREFVMPALPAKYAKMVQYTDCLVDTTAQIFRDTALKTGGFSESEENRKVEEFNHYIHRLTDKPALEGENYDAYSSRFNQWYYTRMKVLADSAARTSLFKQLLTAAVRDALTNGGSDEEFEEYVTAFYSPEAALELKRKRVVIGSCSMDLSPRHHAFAIAQLSAETVKWEIFLRAHLDIMNDNFRRVSDGNYAWGQRQTYIRELEELDINVPDLLLGISLRIHNPAPNHYVGSIGRLGRSLAETQHPELVETHLLTMIQDQELDDFNRLLMYFLFRNYNYYLQNKKQQEVNQKRLTESVKTLPPYLASRILVREKQKE